MKLAQAKRFYNKTAFDKVNASRKPYNPGGIPMSMMYGGECFW